MIICKQCKEKFPCDEFGESPDFDGHDCPSTLRVHKGESWEAYKARCDAHELKN